MTARVFGLAFSPWTGEPLPEPEPHPLYDAVDAAVVAALRAKPHSRRMLSRVVTAAGIRCTPAEDRAVVFALERLACRGYLVRPFGDRYHLLAEPVR